MKEKTKKANSLIAKGAVQITGGAVSIILAGVIDIVRNALSILGGNGLAGMSAVMIIGSVIGGLLILCGVMNAKLAAGYRKMVKTVGDSPAISFINLERRLYKNRKQILKMLRKQMNKGLWPGAHMDMTSETFMVDYTPIVINTDTGNAAVDGRLGEAGSIIGEMKSAAHQINDAQMKARAEHLTEIAGQIYTYVSKFPDKAGLVRQLSNYFLPTTAGLLKKYIELQSQPVKTAVMTEAMDKIKDVMATLEEVYKNQLDALMSDKMLDVDVEIEVLQNMAGL